MEKFSKVLGLDNVVAMGRSPKIADIFFPDFHQLNLKKGHEVVIFNIIVTQKLGAPRKNKPEQTTVLACSETMYIFLQYREFLFEVVFQGLLTIFTQ